MTDLELLTRSCGRLPMLFAKRAPTNLVISELEILFAKALALLATRRGDEVRKEFAERVRR